MARLPVPGADSGAWGAILNEYLLESLATDGTLNPNTVGSAQLKAQSIPLSALASDVVSAMALTTSLASAESL